MGFDHFPTCLSSEATNSPQKWRASFKFESMWFMHNEFFPLLKTWWLQAPYELRSIMYRFGKKMQFLKGKIKQWNIHVFKNIFHQKDLISKQFAVVNEQIISQGLTTQSFEHQRSLQVECEELVLCEEMYWCHKSCELWLSEGDKNTKFFHMPAQVKKAKSTMFFIQESALSKWLNNEVDIQNKGIKFFSNFFSAPIQ